MNMSKEGDTSTIGKKKHKKQKVSVISELGMDSNLEVADEDNPQKNDVSKDETVEDMDKRSKKKKKKDQSQIDVHADGADNKREGKIKKGKNGDKWDPSYLLENSVERIDKESLDYRVKNGAAKSDPRLVSDIGLLKGEDENARGEGHQKKKKKYKTEVDGKKKLSNDVSDVAFVENHMPHEVNVKDRSVKNKKQDKVQENFVEASSSKTLLGNNAEDGVGSDGNNEYMKQKKTTTRTEKRKADEFAGSSDIVVDASYIENPTDHKITEKVEPVKDRKQKKKKDREVLDAAFSQKEPLDDSHVNAIREEDNRVRSSKRKETSFKSKKKGDAPAGLSETKGINGSSITDLVDNQINNGVIKEKKRKKKDGASGACSLEELGKTTPVTSVGDSKESKDKGSKKRKEKSLRCNNEGANVDMLENNEMNEATEPSENFNSNKSSKKVKFSENVEVFPLHKSSSKGKKKKLEDGSEEKNKVDDGLIRGKRFSKEEDDIIRGAVLKYIEDYKLGEQGVEMVMKSRAHPELKDCWKAIGEALPYRPYLAVYYRAHILFERSESRKWTPDEFELVKKFYEKHGPDWRTLGDELGKHRFHVKDAWRRIKLANMKKGNWSQEEYQELFNLVNTDLSMKAFAEKKTKHGMLRDNISWEAISEQLSTRSNSICCMKWYNQLTSPMVAEGIWANTDDYKLLIALSDLDASCEEDVDWDDLLEHRSGDICRKRWNQMVRHIGEYGTKSFSEQVDVLSERYCPNILEARETYDNKTPVD